MLLWGDFNGFNDGFVLTAISFSLKWNVSSRNRFSQRTILSIPDNRVFQYETSSSSSSKSLDPPDHIGGGLDVRPVAPDGILCLRRLPLRKQDSFRGGRRSRYAEILLLSGEKLLFLVRRGCAPCLNNVRRCLFLLLFDDEGYAPAVPGFDSPFYPGS